MVHCAQITKSSNPIHPPILHSSYSGWGDWLNASCNVQTVSLWSSHKQRKINDMDRSLHFLASFCILPSWKFHMINLCKIINQKMQRRRNKLFSNCLLSHKAKKKVLVTYILVVPVAVLEDLCVLCFSNICLSDCYFFTLTLLQKGNITSHSI